MNCADSPLFATTGLFGYLAKVLNTINVAHKFKCIAALVDNMLNEKGLSMRWLVLPNQRRLCGTKTS